MPAFRRVDQKQAGATALGILVPPGLRSLVVLRPRHLPWDLLAVTWSGTEPPRFAEFTRDEAVIAARSLLPFLEDAVQRRHTPVETLGDGQAFQVWVRTPDFFWLTCRREPGRAYRPAVFATLEEAKAIAEELVRVFCPAPDACQEFYFNTQQFMSE